MNTDTHVTTSRLPLAIARRPVDMINCWNGDEGDRLGLNTRFWAGDDAEAVVGLDDELSAGYRVGYRRFMLILPAGYPHNQRLYPSSQWLTMSERRRVLLLDMLPRWKQAMCDSTVELYVYMGIALADPTSLVMPSQAEAKTPSILDDWQWFQSNMRGWLDCGVTGFGFDNASKPKHVEAFVEIARVLSIAGIKCIGEAIPITTADGEAHLGQEFNQAPWFALDQYYENHDPKHRLRYDPRTTECGVGLRESMKIDGKEDRVPVTEELIRNFVQRGLIPYVYASKWDKVVMDIERVRLATDPDTDTDTGDAG